MKIFVLSFLALVVSAPAFAQESPAQRAVRISERVARSVRQQADRLDQQTLRSVIQQLRGVEATLTGQGPALPPPGGGGDGGGHGGGNGREVSIRGSIETVEFDIIGSTLLDLNSQCQAFVLSKGLTRVDDMKISVNYGNLITKNNASGYWIGAAQVCNNILDQVREENIRVPVGAGLVATGTIENVSFTFIGQNLIDVERQCEMFVKQKGLTRVDDIVVNFNFEGERVRNNASGYWQGSIEICQAMSGT